MNAKVFDLETSQWVEEEEERKWERHKAPEPFRVHRECTPQEFLLLLMIDDHAPLDLRLKAAMAAAKLFPKVAWIDDNGAEDFGLRSVDFVPIRKPETPAEKALWDLGVAPRRRG